MWWFKFYKKNNEICLNNNKIIGCNQWLLTFGLKSIVSFYKETEKQNISNYSLEGGDDSTLF
jgi:hypothetical protein